MNNINSRLKMIIDMASVNSPNAERLIDVGSDHGLLSVWCIKHGIAKTALLTDINEGPLEKSKQAISDNNIADRADVLLTDGLDNVVLKDGDIVVIAGMGGNNIMDIVGRACDRRFDGALDVTFYLQPQKSLPELREWLSGRGFVIIDEEYVNEAGFYYCALCVKYKGGAADLSDEEIYYGPVMLKKFDRYPEYKKFLDRVYKVRARGDGRLAELMRRMENEQQSNS